VAQGVPLQEAIVQSAITRAQPIVLTGAGGHGGAFFILDDPIFNGLAISLIFGILVSTVLTLVVIPTCTTRGLTRWCLMETILRKLGIQPGA
jgi:multidrug efflux pump subunit AcrB